MRSTARLVFALVIGLSQHGALAFAPSMRPSRHHRSMRSTSTNEEAVAAVNPRDEGLALQLDDGTRKSHSIAENTAFVSGFFKGLSTRKSYSDLITSLYFVYEAMEKSFDTAADKRVKALDKPELRRLQSLRMDMEYFYGTEQPLPSRTVMSPATKAYVARIEEIATGDKPYLLIGHQYSRYLGDLFGGQMMGSMAVRSLDLSDGQGVQFYEFEEIDNTKDYISGWYQILNELDLTEDEKKEIVDEANYCFALNIAIFEELEGSALKAMVTLGINSLKRKFGFN